ncbi:hypothetical protein ACEN4A_05820 [Latilactobacillus sakei]|uniref:hypothetical protein n=1 Tax=Latilactobacillus sakei TaxID=1599 RepID=UPI0038843FF1
MVEKVKENKKVAIIVAVVVVLLGGFFHMRSKQVNHVIKNGMYEVTFSTKDFKEKMPGRIIFNNQNQLVTAGSDDDFKKVIANPDLAKTELKKTSSTYTATKDSLSFTEGNVSMTMTGLKVQKGGIITGRMHYDGVEVNVLLQRVGELK